MTQDDVHFFTSWFEEYAKSHFSGDEKVEANLSYKKEHSLRVRDHSSTFMRTLGRLRIWPLRGITRMKDIPRKLFKVF